MPEDPKPEPDLQIVIDVNIKAPAWAAALPHLGDLSDKVVREVLSNPASWCHYQGGLPEVPMEVSICFTDNETVQALNAKYRKKNSATNVLSFPASGGEPALEGQEVMLGDVILAYDVVAEEATAQDKSFKDHTIHLLVHGVLHLVGHSHDEEEPAEAMEALEVKTLAILGIADPYTATEAKGA